MSETSAVYRLSDAVLERDLSQWLVDTAALHGWRVFRVHNSRHSPAGWPDLVLCKPPRLVFAELKRERGRPPTTAQMSWLFALDRCTEIETHVWKPSDQDDILALLGGVG